MLLRHPWQALLSITGIALGVAVVLAVDLAGASAGRAFELASASVTGRATHHLVGAPGGLDERLYTRLRTELGLRQVAPVVEEWVRVAGEGGRALHLLGIDPLAEAPFRPDLTRGEGDLDLRRLLSPPSGVVLATSTASQLGLSLGDLLPLEIGGRERRLELIGLLEPENELSREALDGLLVLDIAAAQELLGREGRLSRIDLVLYYDYASDRGLVVIDRAVYAREWSDSAISGVSLYLGPGVDIDRLIERIRALGKGQRMEVRSERALREESLRVFERTFLITDVLRLLATLVAFIGVLSALMALQLERRREFGVLRALGLTRRRLWGLITAQSGLIGLVAGLLAAPVGILMAAMMIFVINRRSFGWTMPLEVSPATLGQAVRLAVGAALLAGLLPAFRLARSPAAEALREE